LQAEDEQVENETVVLQGKGSARAPCNRLEHARTWKMKDEN
jgi:hypothetical protein